MQKIWIETMNTQKLKDFAEKAGLSYMPSNDPDMADLYKGADFELEKFAELIIRECNRVIHDGTNPSIFYQQRILRHFGVEE